MTAGRFRRTVPDGSLVDAELNGTEASRAPAGWFPPFRGNNQAAAGGGEVGADRNLPAVEPPGAGSEDDILWLLRGETP